MNKLFFTLFLLCGSIPLCAESFVATNSAGIDITYNVISSGDLTCEVTQSSATAYTGDIVVPASAINPNDGKTYAVTGVGASAFYSCSGLSSVSAESVTTIGNYAFCYDNALEKVAFPNVTSVGTSAFYSCKGLKEADMASVEELANYAFCYDDVLGEVNMPNLSKIGTSAFYSCSGIKSVSIPKVTQIEDYAFEYGSSIAEIDLGCSLTSLGQYAFYFCTSLTYISVPDGVTQIQEGTFAQCTALENATLGDDVTTMGKWAFYNCEKVVVNLPSSLTLIDYGAFENCTGLDDVVIPEKVTQLGNYAFYYCTGISRMTSLNPTPPSCGSYVFYGMDTDACLLRVPEGSGEQYANASQWSSFYRIEEIDTSGIGVITSESAEITGYYTVSGQKVNTPQKGIYVARYSDGTTRKICLR